MHSTINLSFRYAERDYVRALRSHYASHLRLRLDIAVTVILAGIGIYFWRLPSRNWLGIAWFTVLPKRVFQSVEQQAFEQLLTHHVSPIVRRDR